MIMSEDRNVFSEFAEILLTKHYKKETDKNIMDIFKRTANNYCYGDFELRDRLISYVEKRWFNFSSPPLSNSVEGEWVSLDKDEIVDWKTHKFVTNQQIKAMPISCFVQSVEDSLEGQISSATELAWLSTAGGGVGQAILTRGITDKSPGAIPYIKTADSNIMYYHQAGTRRGSVASYLDISHPDIVEFIGIRNPTGGDVNRKCLNVNIAVNITDEFLYAVKNDLNWELLCPHTKKITSTHKARDLWQEILETRFKTGEPYLHYIDEANRKFPQSLKNNGFSVFASNLCSEIELYQDKNHTSVCCLSSLNLEYYNEWKDTRLVEDLITLLDNIIEWFITYAPKELYKAVNSASGSRDLGLGTMGWHYYLQKNNIPFASGGLNSSMQLSNIIFKSIKEKSLEQSKKLANIRGEPEYLKDTGLRNGHLLAIAPNANSSLILDTSPSIEPISANIFNHRTRVGSHIVKNRYLDLLLKEKSKEYENSEQWVTEQWKLIMDTKGSVQDLDCLTDHEKKVYLTAYEIPQEYVIDQARIRQSHICQSQSVNLFFKEGVSKKYVNDVHIRAFSNDENLPGVPMKTLYYCRASKEASVERVSGEIKRVKLENYETQEVEKEECLSCSG